MARYELLERIGMGGMAEIFRGTAIAGGGFEKLVAIKRILPHLSQDQRFIELLIAEAKILSELQHRNIVQIYDVGLGDDGQYFLVMEFVDGTDLGHIYEQLFDGRILPVEVALHICSEICEALEHAHIAKDAQGAALALVHRDVSPSNVLLSRSGEVKLTDFGIAKRVEEVTGHGGVRGKFAYISPEQAVNEHVDARSDVYSVGILLYELVCGQRLFSGLADFDALREVRHGRIRPSAEHVPGVDPELAQIIMRALSKEPGQRFQSAGEFGSALRGYRYSLDTVIADPSAEIAALVTREKRRGTSEDEFPEMDGDFSSGGGSTVVRIDTAAEFSLTDLSGLHQLVSSYPEPRIDDSTNVADLLDDEKTIARANPLLEEPTALSAEPQFADTRENQPLGPPETAPKSMPLLPSPLPAPVARRRPQLARAATPTERDVFHAHAPLPAGPGQIPSHYPGYSGHPPGFLDVEADARRRKLRMGLTAGALALLAFVIAGHFLSDREAVSSAPAGVDAGVHDAGLEEGMDAAAALVPDASVDEARIRKREQRRAKRRRAKRRRAKRRRAKKRAREKRKRDKSKK